jgi:lipopolysaccharide transport system ATP-binding protein
MSDIVIKAENIGKKYVIGHQAEKGRGVTFREVLMQNARTLWSKTKDLATGKPIIQGDTMEEVWALKDVSFEIRRGEAVGIIGRNGAGKSTLLKILSRITEPSTGRVTIKGRVASLLEVGTGFHPELTGRENIYLNGTILGMTREEIKRKFDEIVAFAEVIRFLDTPVKRYSSGMYVRLAFAVAAHLEPEILVVDEVLAVGDAQFQKKCLGKMEQVGNEGRTVLFVSHNMNAIEQLCRRVIVLNEGNIEYNGPTESGISQYLNIGIGLEKEKNWDIKRAPGNNIAKIFIAYVHTDGGEICSSFDITKKIGITMEYEVFEDGHSFTHGINLFNEEGINVFNSHDVVSKIRLAKRKKGVYVSTAWIPENILAEGTFTAGLAIFNPAPFILHALAPNALTFKVVDHMRGDSARGNYNAGFPGIVRPLLNWETNKKK